MRQFGNGLAAQGFQSDETMLRDFVIARAVAMYCSINAHTGSANLFCMVPTVPAKPRSAGWRNWERQQNGTFIGLADMQCTGMELIQAGPMADRQYRCTRELLRKYGQHRGLIIVVKSRCGLIHEDPLRLVEKDAREGDTLLLAKRKRSVPALGAIEHPGKFMQADPVQSRLDCCIVERIRARGIAYRRAETAKRQIGPLRQKHHVTARRCTDNARSPGPKPGDRAKQRALARSRDSDDQNALAGTDLGLP